MASDSNFVTVTIPKFDGHYDYWSMMMETFLHSKELWDLIEDGIPIPSIPTQPASFATTVTGGKGEEVRHKQAEEQHKKIEEMKLKDLKVRNYLFQAIDRTIMETILDRDSSKSIWDSMKQKYHGMSKVKRAHRQALRKEFELLQMRDGETVDEFFGRTLTIIEN